MEQDIHKCMHCGWEGIEDDTVLVNTAKNSFIVNCPECGEIMYEVIDSNDIDDEETEQIIEEELESFIKYQEPGTIRIDEDMHQYEFIEKLNMLLGIEAGIQIVPTKSVKGWTEWGVVRKFGNDGKPVNHKTKMN